MSRLAVPGTISCLLALVAGGMGGCGGAHEPRDEDVWHSSALRPGAVPAATEGERELLARLDDVPSSEPVRLGGQSFVVDEPYTAASGRVCRSVTARSVEGAALDVKLACQQDGGWVFVPDVFGDSGAQMAEVEP